MQIENCPFTNGELLPFHILHFQSRVPVDKFWSLVLNLESPLLFNLGKLFLRKGYF